MIQLPPPDSPDFNTELVRTLTQVLNEQRQKIVDLEAEVADLKSASNDGG